jgi:signal transduction histidine kinase
MAPMKISLKRHPGKMFSLVRFFAIANAIALISVAALLYGLYRQTAADEIIRTAEQNNATLASVIANAVLPVYEESLVRGDILYSAKWSDEKLAARVDETVRSLVRGLPVVKVLIYDSEENIIYSSAPGEVGAIGADNAEGFRGALNGEPRSEIEFRSYIEGFGVARRDLQIVETYTPFVSGSGTVLGVFELYSDVTERVERIEVMSAGLLTGLAIVFSMLYAGLLIAIRHVNRIIASQYRELEESRADADAKNGRLLEEIAHRNQVEAELRRAREEAELASQTKSRFLHNMSHELRTPLNAVIGFSEIIAEQVLGSVNPPRYREYASDIRESGWRLLSLVDDILDLSKIESGRERLDLAPLDIAEVVRSAARTVEPHCQHNGNELVLDGLDGFGEISSDKSKILSILTNLLSNAAKFTRNGRIAVVITREESFGGWMVVEVRDTGIGMKVGPIDEMFEDFTQHDNLISRTYGGTGLGLAISRRYCQMLGGEISIDSEIGKGTSVTVRLPAVAKIPEATKIAAE